MKVKEFLARYDVGEQFNEKELREIFWLDFEEDEDDTCHVIEEETTTRDAGPAIMLSGLISMSVSLSLMLMKV